ncbi:hypothetical protein B0F90DRAFT_1918443 [Multifurca ochricompacta]|uniref:Uncharacterized protein n=1 Tax=Multifurca ochricompacta TaxID=376703 RepID=A0AAD4M3M6_9AGAM|nr:hypothetical protein B0F90DRAFT_1918443 [Multifurca ochricompacta]
MVQELSIMELDQMITSYQCALSWTPRSHPTYTACIHLLAKSQFIRYELSEQREDLDKSIVHYTEAIFLPPSSRLYLNVVQVFFQLVLSLLHRSEKFKQPEDAKCAVEYLRYLRELPLKTFEVPHEFATHHLFGRWVFKLSWKRGTGDIEEMLILCQELLTCTAQQTIQPGHSPCSPISCKYCQEKKVQPLDGIIQCFRDALKIFPPGSHMRFMNFGLTEALQEARSYTSEMVSLASSSSAHGTSQEKLTCGCCPGGVSDGGGRGENSKSSKTDLQDSAKVLRAQRVPPTSWDWYRTKFSRTNDITDLEEGSSAAGYYLRQLTRVIHLDSNRHSFWA